MVFQSYAIWPHMNVFKNVAFPLEVRKARPSRKEIEQKVMRVLAAVQLAELADRDATKLSGGQQQRLALARALVMEPQLLLLDEPLSNLDAKLREKMRFELKRMQRDFGLTTVYVTHDQSEALALSHEIAVMNEGRIVQIGSPRDIYERPRNKFVADFVGNTNFHRRHHAVGRRPTTAAAGSRPRSATSTCTCVERLTTRRRSWCRCGPKMSNSSETAPARGRDDNLYRRHRRRQSVSRRLSGFSGQSRRICPACPGAPLVADADRRSYPRAHAGGKMRRDRRDGGAARGGLKSKQESQMAKNAVVSEDLANKFKTEKETPYTRWVKAEGLDILPSIYVQNLRTRRTEAMGAARRQRGVPQP